MARVKRSVNAKKKRREILKSAKGYRGQRSRLYRKAKEQWLHSMAHSPFNFGQPQALDQPVVGDTVHAGGSVGGGGPQFSGFRDGCSPSRHQARQASPGQGLIHHIIYCCKESCEGVAPISPLAA